MIDVSKAWQRQIREKNSEFPELFIDEKAALAKWMGNATVSEISYDTAKQVILQYEWLGNMGTTEYAYGLFFGPYLAGAVCFGRTAGSNVYTSVCGENASKRAITLCRGACVYWAHPHSASYLISSACKEMSRHSYNVFIAYSDPDAGEVGTVYQACNWNYCGMTSATEKFKTPDGKVRDSRLVHAYTRDRRGGTVKYVRSRAEQKKLMIDQGCEFFKGNAKHRYVGIYGTKDQVRKLRESLKWEVLPYPKRAVQQSEVTPTASSDGSEVRSLGTAPIYEGL